MAGFYITPTLYIEFILVRLWRKLLAYINALESIPGTNQYWAISVKFIDQGINGLSLTGFEPMQLAILGLLVWRVNHSTTPPPTLKRLRGDFPTTGAGSSKVPLRALIQECEGIWVEPPTFLHVLQPWFILTLCQVVSNVKYSFLFSLLKLALCAIFITKVGL